MVLRAVRGRTAANTAQTILYDVICHKGYPLLIHSDAAREFLSTAMASLCAITGMKQTTTKAHNPQGNATIERVWAFVGKCLKQMSREQYENFHLYTPLMALAWNCTENSVTKISPFQAEHGMPPRTLAKTFLENPPDEGLAAGGADLQTIITSVEAFTKQAEHIQALAKVRTADILNTRGTAYKFKVGNKVSFYIPPSQSEAKKAGRKPKHLLWYRGPATIVTSLSTNHTTFRLHYKGSFYERTVANVRPYKSKGEPMLYQLINDTAVTKDSFIAVLDDIDDQRYHLANVIDIHDDLVTVHYYATRSQNIVNAVWKPLWMTPRRKEVTWVEPQGINKESLRFTGTFSIADDKDDLIILSNVGLTEGNRIKSVSRKALSDTGRLHQIRGTTWKAIQKKKCHSKGKTYRLQGTRKSGHLSVSF